MEAKGDTRLLSEQPDRETAHLPEGARSPSTRARVLLHR
jgi:hypothetical protein